MKKLLAATLCSLAALSFPLAAQAEAYFGINYTQLKQDNRFSNNVPPFEAGKDDFSTGDVFLRLGGVINKYVSAEMRVGSTAADKTDGDLTYRFNYNAGLYGKLSLPLGFINIYSLVGYTWGEEQMTTEVGNTKTRDKGHLHDWSLGSGIDINLGKHLGINAEYTVYYDIGNVQFMGPSAGVFYRF